MPWMNDIEKVVFNQNVYYSQFPTSAKKITDRQEDMFVFRVVEIS